VTGFQGFLLLLVLGTAAVHVLHRFAPRYPTLVGRVVSDLVGLGALLAFVLSITVVRIPPGYVGIKINNLGPHRGVQDITLRTGLVFYAPVATTVFEYPTFVQTAVWTRSLTEGRPVNEEISFNSSEGLVFTSDISLAYRLMEARIPHFYVQFRSDDLAAFTHGFLRNVARDAFNELGAHYTAEEIYGTKRENFLAETRKRINNEVDAYGVRIEQLGFIGAPRAPQAIVDAINAKIKAIQDALRVENELRQARAQAAKDVAEAEGRARANQLLASSLSQVLLQWRQLEITDRAIGKWDGRRPMVEGQSSGLLLSLPTAPTPK
jgi:regulator of protease activity HflC (stomatin/prohibitin superfamily)